MPWLFTEEKKKKKSKRAIYIHIFSKKNSKVGRAINLDQLNTGD